MKESRHLLEYSLHLYVSGPLAGGERGEAAAQATKLNLFFLTIYIQGHLTQSSFTSQMSVLLVMAPSRVTFGTTISFPRLTVKTVYLLWAPKALTLTSVF